jgi:hypothetical protein
MLQYGGNISNGGGNFQAKLVVYPNPVNNVLNISADFSNINNNDNWSYSIINNSGIILISENNLLNLPESIEVDNLAAGTYFIHICKGNNNAISKFIKE